MTVAAFAANKVQSLPKLDPAHMELTNALLGLLSDGMRVDVSSYPRAFRAFSTANGFAFGLLSATGSCMLGGDDSVDHACDIVDKCDALLRAVEERLGVPIEPIAVDDATQSLFGDDQAVILSIAGQDRTLLLAIKPDAAQRSLWLEAAATAKADLSNLPMPFSVEFEAAKLPVAEVAQIEGGDMLLLPRKVSAIWHGEGANPLGHGVLDLIRMTIQQDGPYHDEGESGMNDDDAPDADAAFKVPVTVRLPTKYVEAATLAALRVGGSLQLGPLVHGLPVELLVGGRRIGSGEIVEIGENFAVLVDERETSSPRAETHGEVDLGGSASDGE